MRKIKKVAVISVFLAFAHHPSIEAYYRIDVSTELFNRNGSLGNEQYLIKAKFSDKGWCVSKT